jgi:hypothetical protein
LDKKQALAIALIIIIAAATIAIAYAIITYMTIIPSTGGIQEVKINTPASIDWGDVENGTLATKTIQITNTGNKACTLSLTTANRSGTIITLSLLWDYTGTPINPQQAVNVQLMQTLTATGDWSYDVIVTATG